MYGPGDCLDAKTNHVVPALIVRFLHAQKTEEPFVTLWGTGKATREFLYVDDCADGIIKAMLWPAFIVFSAMKFLGM